MKGLEVAYKTPLKSVVTKRPEKSKADVFDSKKEGLVTTKSNAWVGEARVLFAFVMGLVIATLLGKYEAVLRDVVGAQVGRYIRI